MSESLVKVEPQEQALSRPSPREIIKAATDEANVLADVIDSRQLYSVIQGRKFVKVEGWTTLATLRGCLPREVAVHEMPEGRYIAEVELVRMGDGTVLTKASAECGGPDDPVWAKRPPNARRSMAITRATGKACRVAFSWVMALTGYEVTPAEEMDHVENGAAKPSWTPPTNVGPPKDAPVWTGRIVDAKIKSGNTNRKPWTLFTFIGEDGTEFGTFSETIAAGLTKLEKGAFVEIFYSKTEKGNNTIEEFRDATKDQVPI